MLQRTLAVGVGLAAHNLSALVHHQLLLRQAARRMVGRSVPDLRARAHGGHLAMALACRVGALAAVSASLGHLGFY